MRKRIPVIALVGTLLACALSAPAFAAGPPAVVYDGKDGTFAFQNIDENGLFGAFQDVMPGYERTTEIRIEMRDASPASRLYLRAEPADGSNAALEGLTLRVSQNGTVLDSGSGARCLGSDVLLGTFSGSEDTALEVTLTVPTEVGNEMAGQMGELRWIFTVQEEGGASHEGAVTLPKTGEGWILPCVAVVALASGAALVVSATRRRQEA